MKILGLLNNELNFLGIDNEFYSYSKKIPNHPYWVYEYIITNYEPECNEISGVLILNGFTRKEVLELEENKDKIVKYFKHFTKIIDDTGIAINSGPGQYRNTTDKEIKQIELKLDFKEWEV